MASGYAYTDKATLESFMVLSLTSIDARYTNAVIDAKITQAERWINDYCGQSFSGTIPDGIINATLELARYYMEFQLYKDRYMTKEEIESFDMVFKRIKQPLEKNKVNKDFGGSSTNFNLPDLMDT